MAGGKTAGRLVEAREPFGKNGIAVIDQAVLDHLVESPQLDAGCLLLPAYTLEIAAALLVGGIGSIQHLERLASVHEVDPATIDEFRRVEASRADEDVVQAIAASIADGFNTKMILGKEAAARANVSARQAYRLIEQYTGDDPALHRWRFVIRARGAKTFELLPPPEG